MGDFITIRDTARIFDVHENTVRNWITRRIIRNVSVLPSGVRRIPLEEVERLKTAMVEGPSSLAESRIPSPLKFVEPGEMLDQYPT
jgi:transposase-like protein